MIAKFKDAREAVEYVCREFTVGGQSTHAEVSCFPVGDDPNHSSTAVSMARLTPMAMHFCQHFPEAVVGLNLVNGIRPLAVVQCRCNEYARKRCPRGCHHHKNRPLVLIMACDKDSRPTEEERRLAVRDFHRDERAFREEQRRKRHSHHRSSISSHSQSHSSASTGGGGFLRQPSHRGLRK